MAHYRKTEIWKSVDWLTIVLYLLLIVAGWFSICGASYEFDNMGLFDPQGRPGMQLIWIATSFVLIFVILMLDSDFFDVFAYFIYGLVALLLIATIFLAPDIKGSHSWLVLGPIRLQPAELAKFATALAVAKYMDSYGFKLTTPKNFSVTLLLILFPMVCILLQKETGSALVYLAFFLMLYREGMTGYVLLAGICAVIYFVLGMKYAGVTVGTTSLDLLIVSCLILTITMILVALNSKTGKTAKKIGICILISFTIAGLASIFTPINFAWVALGLLGGIVVYLFYLAFHLWILRYVLIGLFSLLSIGFLFSVSYVFNEVLEPHQQVRILVSLGLKDDPSGAGYNVNQSKIAIGSGGFSGKGFLNGTQTKLKYVPEQDTDFIFCTVGEEQGFIGATTVLILFTVFILRLIILAEKQDRTFFRVYGYSVASIFFFHLAINIGMVIGLTPVIGIPLPFFSYGGSSLWGFTILLFIFLRLDASRKER